MRMQRAEYGHPLEIANVLDDRLRDHRDKVRELRRQHKLDKADSPLNLIADGDSWFDYPMGEGLNFLGYVDAIKQLQGKGVPFGMMILNFAHWGDALKFQITNPYRLAFMRQCIRNADDYGTFDGMLVSAGGNDFVGPKFADYLEEAKIAHDPANAITEDFDKKLEQLAESYEVLIEFRDENLKGKPIFVNGYDNAWPDNRGVRFCRDKGGWLAPSLRKKGWMDLEEGKLIVLDALTRFRVMITKLSEKHRDVILAPTASTLTNQNQWDNELHPNTDGFALIAEKFLTCLKDYPLFAGRL